MDGGVGNGDVRRATEAEWQKAQNNAAKVDDDQQLEWQVRQERRCCGEGGAWGAIVRLDRDN